MDSSGWLTASIYFELRCPPSTRQFTRDHIILLKPFNQINFFYLTSLTNCPQVSVVK